MEVPSIKKLSPNKVFKSKDEVRNWIFENKEHLEEAIQTKLSYVKYFTEAPWKMRPDIYTEEKQTCYRIAVMITLKEITGNDFAKFITMASFNDIKKGLWIVSKFDKRTQLMIDWLNDQMEGNVEFKVLQLGVYQLDNSRLVIQLEKLNELEATLDYADYF